MKTKLPYDPTELPRELKRHYISASEADISEMLKFIGCSSFEDLYKHFSEDIKFQKAPDLPKELEYEDLQSRLESIAAKNNIRTSFVGDALPLCKPHEVVNHVASIRNLTTSYTPYQAERSQGTLISLWNYQCALSMLTGFEAINASLYDRSTALFEAICCTIRLSKTANTVLVSEGIFPQDKEVLDTLIQDTKIFIQYVPLDKSGLININELNKYMDLLGPKLAGVAFPQVNQLGLIEDVDTITNLISKKGLKSIGIIDPMHIVTGGLKPPSAFGIKGVDIFVGEGQHLAIGANFGGPGLGIFGVRHNNEVKNMLRLTPGRYVGKGKDIEGKDAYIMILSTREQHIRKDKATSNICSNQAFLATLAGAAILAKGEEGMAKCTEAGRSFAHYFANKVLRLKGISLAYPDQAFFNECVIKLDASIEELINKASRQNLDIGVYMTDRTPFPIGEVLKISFSDNNTREEVDTLISFFNENFELDDANDHKIPVIQESSLRIKPVQLPTFTTDEVKSHYDKLGELNISPDDTCYPLGSCTMKYNPHVNDWAANLPGFTDLHPQASQEDAQGSLEILYEIQEWFKSITGLDAVTTQPVAGAQGELVALKMFQAYHKRNGELGRRKIFIPKSAHGTNFATAIMAGCNSDDIVYLEADSFGHIDQNDLDEKLKLAGDKICGVMVTNPNTGGLFETGFKSMADKVHQAGGLVFMDGANMNAIAGWVNLEKLGVDAVHNNLHKTWTIPHGGGGPGDAIVAVSSKLTDFLPGYQVELHNNTYIAVKPKYSIGSVHRHWGNFAHKVRCYTYLLRLGKEGVRRMSAMAVLCARYMHIKLKDTCPSLPLGADQIPRMHEFILSLTNEEFQKLEAIGLSKAAAIPRVGKLFLDFGFHSPTVAFPEPLGLMIEPTESYTKDELDRLIQAIVFIKKIINEHPLYLNTTPAITPVNRIDEVNANRNIQMTEKLSTLPVLPGQGISFRTIQSKSIPEIYDSLLESVRESTSCN